MWACTTICFSIHLLMDTGLQLWAVLNKALVKISSPRSCVKEPRRTAGWYVLAIYKDLFPLPHGGWPGASFHPLAATSQSSRARKQVLTPVYSQPWLPGRRRAALPLLKQLRPQEALPKAPRGRHKPLQSALWASSGTGAGISLGLRARRFSVVLQETAHVYIVPLNPL